MKRLSHKWNMVLPSLEVKVGKIFASRSKEERAHHIAKSVGGNDEESA
jgi:hypothetical protein